MRLLLFTLPSLLIVVLSGCNYTLMTPGGPSTSGIGAGIDTSSAASQQAMVILSTNCASCHGGSGGPGGVANITDLARLLSSGLIIPGNPSSSPIISAVESGRMPPTGPLSETDRQTLINWVAGTQSGSPTVPSSNPTPTPVPTPDPGSSLATQAISILSNNCVACHGSTASGGIDQITDPAHLVSLGVIAPGSAANSKIYGAIANGLMPPTGAFSSTDISIIENWINSGAATPTVGSPTPVPSPTPTQLFPTYSSIAANILAPKCLSCHGSGSGIRLDTYNNVMMKVTAGQPSQSHLYMMVLSGQMPQGSNSLSTAELQVIYDWISGGAQNN